MPELGQAVKYVVDGEVIIGRVCRRYVTGYACVQFETVCLRIDEDKLESTDEPAPDCSPDCLSGC